jgi:hypothetical protein
VPEEHVPEQELASEVKPGEEEVCAASDWEGVVGEELTRG